MNEENIEFQIIREHLISVSRVNQKQDSQFHVQPLRLAKHPDVVVLKLVEAHAEVKTTYATSKLNKMATVHGLVQCVGYIQTEAEEYKVARVVQGVLSSRPAMVLRGIE